MFMDMERFDNNKVSEKQATNTKSRSLLLKIHVLVDAFR